MGVSRIRCLAEAPDNQHIDPVTWPTEGSASQGVDRQTSWLTLPELTPWKRLPLFLQGAGRRAHPGIGARCWHQAAAAGVHHFSTCVASMLSLQQSLRLFVRSACDPHAALTAVMCLCAAAVVVTPLPSMQSLTRTDRLEDFAIATAVVDMARQQAAKQARGLAHPQLCLDAIAAGIASGGHAGLQKVRIRMRDSRCRAHVNSEQPGAPAAVPGCGRGRHRVRRPCRPAEG